MYWEQAKNLGLTFVGLELVHGAFLAETLLRQSTEKCLKGNLNSINRRVLKNRKYGKKDRFATPIHR